mmetsp:Transcript_8756/g.26208  ORF Transcript_8756/g.26208 Transcript_8756/m.26208 type:complete len:193 (-) Transcript_8756:782-1360(-)
MMVRMAIGAATAASTLALVQSTSAFVAPRHSRDSTPSAFSAAPVSATWPATPVAVLRASSSSSPLDAGSEAPGETNGKKTRKVVVVGAGWGGLSAAHALSTKSNSLGEDVHVTVIDAAPRAGGLVRDGFTTLSGQRPAEAGQHGFWDNYGNIFKLLEDLPNVDANEVLTGYDRQGQCEFFPCIDGLWSTCLD